MGQAMTTHSTVQENSSSSRSLVMKLMILLVPPLIYGAIVWQLGFSGLNHKLDALDPGKIGWPVLVHAAPIVWLMFTPPLLIAGSFTRPKTAIRNYFTSDLAEQYSPESVCMATGAHNSKQFDVRGIDEKVLLTGTTATAPFPSRMVLTIGDSNYEAIYDRVAEPTSHALAQVYYGYELRLSRPGADDAEGSVPMMHYMTTSTHRDPPLIQFDGAPDLWLKPNPESYFPQHYDMVCEDVVVGRVIKPGKWFFCGVLVVTDHYPEQVRTLIAGLCYQMMRG